jgi:hypothetical protein
MTEARAVLIPHLPKRRDPVTGGLVPTIDLRPAEEFGRLIVVESGARWSGNADLIREAIENEPAPMPIVTTGDVVALALAIHFTLKRYDHVTVLRYVRRLRKYFAEEFTL